MTAAPIVVSCFDLTGALVAPWADAGYECHIVDMQHPPGRTTEGAVTKWGMDVREWETAWFGEFAARLDNVDPATNKPVRVASPETPSLESRFD